MRRILAVVGVAMIAALGACSSDDDSKGGDKADAGGGTLTVATSLPAPGFFNGEDPSELDGGFEWGMAQELAERLGYEDVEFQNVSFDALVAGKAQGFDLALSQVTITEDRAKVVDFSAPYFSSDQGILVKAGTEVPDVAAAKALKWGVQGSTTGQTFLEEQIKPDGEPSVFQDTSSMFTALQAGQVDAVLLDTAIVLGQAAESGGELEVVGQFKTGEEYGAILPKGSDLLGEVDAAIADMEAEGVLAALVEEWLVPVFKGDPTEVPYLTV